MSDSVTDNASYCGRWHEPEPATAAPSEKPAGDSQQARQPFNCDPRPANRRPHSLGWTPFSRRTLPFTG